MERIRTETSWTADPMYQPVLTPVYASRRGRVTGELSALATPAVRESWTGAGRKRGRRRNAQVKVHI